MTISSLSITLPLSFRGITSQNREHDDYVADYELTSSTGFDHEIYKQKTVIESYSYQYKRFYPLGRDTITSTGHDRWLLDDLTAKTSDLSDPLLLQLVVAAEQHDEDLFVAAKNAVQWANRPASDFIYAVNLGLSAGAYAAARALATEGSQVHPSSKELCKLAFVLAPPITRVESHQKISGIRANRDWLRDHSHEYRGQWVALQDGALLDHADTLKELRSRIPSSKTILFTKAL